MRTWAKGSRPAALLAVGVMAFTGNGAALADTDGGHSIGGGNQVAAPITLPVDISGNAIGVLGKAEGQSRGGAFAEGGSGGVGGNRTDGHGSVLGGNQVTAPVTAPINACGTAIAVLGNAQADCEGGARAVRGGSGGSGGAGGNRTDGRSSVGGGNQVTAPVTAPINACGNTIAIFGEAVAGCKGGSQAASGGGGGRGGAGGNRTSGTSSVLGGTQAVAPITAPVNLCGNSAAAVGRAFSGCTGGAKAKEAGHKNGKRPQGAGGNDTDGRFGAGSGNQVIAPIAAPVNLCGNAVGNAAAACEGGATVARGAGGQGAGGNTTSGRSGVLSGTQAVAPITAPANVCGNTVGLVGKAFAGCPGGAKVAGGAGGRGAGGNRTDGRHGVLSGTQAVAPITAPVNVCGNSAAVLGEGETACKGGAKVAGDLHSGVGGNRTSGRSGVLAGTQAVAPIVAPANVCGNSAAVLGDAAAGCLGSAKAGGGNGHGYGRPGGGHGGWHGGKAVPVRQSSGLLSVLPLSPSVGGKAAKTDMGRAKLPASSLPVVTDARNTMGLPAAIPHRTPAFGEGMPVVGALPEAGRLPVVPGGLTDLPTAPVAHQASHSAAHHGPAKGKAPKAHGKAAAPQAEAGPLQPVAQLAEGTPVASAVQALPMGNVGLMSAEQPTGVTGMNAGSLLALAIGTMFAASATLFALTRRFRLGRK